MTNLGVMEWDAGNKRPAIALYRRASALGEEHAQHNLGLVFLERGGSRNLRHAFELFTVSGNNGHPNAAYRAACCYFYGEGTRKNMARSLAWFRKAARLGSTKAKKYLKSLAGRSRSTP
jgi:TPR repeat protein